MKNVEHARIEDAGGILQLVVPVRRRSILRDAAVMLAILGIFVALRYSLRLGNDFTLEVLVVLYFIRTMLLPDRYVVSISETDIRVQTERPAGRRTRIYPWPQIRCLHFFYNLTRGSKWEAVLERDPDSNDFFPVAATPEEISNMRAVIYSRFPQLKKPTLLNAFAEPLDPTSIGPART